jgi:hypothetical protein
MEGRNVADLDLDKTEANALSGIVYKSDVLALVAKVRELEQDAARYRWLRTTTYDDAMAATFDGPTRFTAWRRAGQSLDAAIDAAMAASAKGGKHA